MSVPKLRFKADDGSDYPELTVVKLDDLCEKIGDGLHGTPIYFQTGNYYFINGNNLENGKIIVSSDTPKVNDSVFEKNNKELNDSTILMSINGTIGKVAYYNNEKVMLGKSVAYFKVNYKCIKEYCYQLIQTASVQCQFQKGLTGSTIKNLGLNTIKNTNVKVPCLPEQQKIAEFLSTVDTAIEKQKETVSAWEERKKGVMQKLFGQEVRFKADNGSEFPEWEEKYLSDIASFHSGLTFTPDDVVDSENGILVFRSSNIQNGRIAYDDNVYVDKELKEKNYVKLHDIVVCVRNGSKSLVGKNALVTESDLNATWGAFMTVIRAKQNYEFIHQYLNSTFFKKEMYKDSGTATINQITTAMLNDCKLFVPSLAEQQKIADCLSSLDEVIEKQKATLAAWEELKKGLLQQMFV